MLQQTEMDISCTCDENTECVLCYEDVEDNINVIIPEGGIKRLSSLTSSSNIKQQCLNEYLDLSIDSVEKRAMDDILNVNIYQYTDDPKITTELAELKENGLELIQQSTTKTSIPLAVPCLIGSSIATLQWIPIPTIVDDINFLKRLAKRQLIWRKRDHETGLCTRKYAWMDNMNALFDKNLLYPILQLNGIRHQITVVVVAFHNIRKNTSIDNLQGLIGIAAATLCCNDPTKIKIIDYASIRPVASKTTRSYGNFNKLIKDNRNGAVVVYCSDKSSIVSMYRTNVFPWSNLFASIADHFYNIISLVSFGGIERNAIPCVDADIHDEMKCCVQCNMTSTLLNLGSRKSSSCLRSNERKLWQCRVITDRRTNVPFMIGKINTTTYDYCNEFL